MPDEADLAQAHIEAEQEAMRRDKAWREAQRKPRQASEDCEECGEPVGSQRLALGYSMCIGCAEFAEKRARHFGKGK